MTITLHWWYLPIALVACGFIGAWWVGRDSTGGWMDMTPLFSAVVFVLFAAGAVGIVIGRFLA